MTLRPLPNPDHVFRGVQGVESWRHTGEAVYALAVSDPTVAALAITRALVAAGADVLSISQAQHTLEDVYLELIDDDPEANRR